MARWQQHFVSLLSAIAVLSGLAVAQDTTPDAASDAQAAKETSTGPAAQRALEIVRLIDGGTRAEYESYVAENFAPLFLKGAPVDRHLGFFHSMQDVTHGLTLHSLENATPTQVTALCQGALTGRWMGLQIRVEPKPPHRIVALGARGGMRPPDGTPTPKKRSDDEIRDELQALMQKLADADVFSGAVLLARDGVPIFQGAYGQANKDFGVPNQIDTKFNLGSMNKMFTAVAAAQLVERGQLSFDDPLSKFLPDRKSVV